MPLSTLHPEWIEVWKVARALEWDTRRARRMFSETGFAVTLPGAKGWWVRRRLLKTHMQEIADRLFELEEGGLLKMAGRARQKQRTRRPRIGSSPSYHR